MKLVQLNAHHIPCHQHCRWVRSQNCGCLVTWFCYQLIAKPGNKTAAVPWPDPDTDGLMQIGAWWIYIFSPCVELLKVGHEGMWVQFGNQTLIALKWHSCYSGMHLMAFDCIVVLPGIFLWSENLWHFFRDPFLSDFSLINQIQWKFHFATAKMLNIWWNGKEFFKNLPHFPDLLSSY